ncbi:MAG: phosphatidate cytidylyltransferase [Candidatus Eremiobacteraeota bacterium]|nr:phosphatidate cytidylyltransferase [Candidatus Eremiobacteraeota bacterium]
MNTIAAGRKDTIAARFRRELSAKRVIIGFVVAAVGLASIASEMALAIFIGVIAVAGAVEFANLARRAGGEVALPVAVASCAAYPIFAYLGWLPAHESALVVAIVVAAFVASITAPLDHFAERAALTLLCAMYLGKLLSYYIVLRHAPFGAQLVACLVVTVALTDIVGMIVGLGFGHHQLAPRLSPAKTVEGALAALVVATLAGAGIWWVMRLPGPWWLAIAYPLSVSIAAEFGDLVESALKRNAHVKDAGNLIAGHGGVLDRFDSYIFACVVGCAMLLLGGRPL